jgi:hypothetical protein
MSNPKGPYSTGDSAGLVFKDGKGVENFDSERDKLNACRLANTAWSQGRSSRDGLRKALEDIRDCNWTLWIGDRLDPVRYLACTALEADGEGR